MALPDLGDLRRALRKITDRLMREVDAPTADPPEWSSFEWTLARSVTAMQGIGGLLANCLRWRSPRRFLDFVREQREHTAAFRERARAKLAQIDAQARVAGVPFVPLKGAALFEFAIHGHGERTMSDLDLLVDAPHLKKMTAAIEACGYIHSHTSRRHATFKPIEGTRYFGYADHRDNPLRVELHTRVAERLPVTEVDITAAIWPARLVPGSNRYASRAALMRHLLSHAAGNMRAHALRGFQALDIAAFATQMTESDWDELFEDDRVAAWWLYPPLALAANTRRGSIAPAVLERAARLSPRRLRRWATRRSVFEVSWSNPRIAAFPGIEWSRTPAEMCRLVRTRVLPNQAELTELHEGVAALPMLLNVSWYELSHPRRILRWVSGRAPRVQTLVSVMAACSEP